METLTRKQREIRQREQMILDVARQALSEVGYLGLKMDRIAEELEYSKGTIYQHFRNKEDVMMALAIQTMQVRCELFDRASTFNGRPRERMMAIGMAAELFVRLHPDHFKVEQILKTESIREKTSEEYQNKLYGMELRCVSIVSGIVRDAISQGDMALPEGVAPEDLTFALWSMSFGAFSIMSTGTPLMELGVSAPAEALSHGYDALLDGYQWAPLTTEHDYELTEQRIVGELFADEFTALEHVGV